MLSFPMCTMFEQVWRNILQKIEQGNLLFFLYHKSWDLGFSKVGINHIVDVTYSQNGAM